MHELLSVVAHEVSQLCPLGSIAGVTVSEGALPVGDADDVFVVIPHEYFVVMPAAQLPTSDQLRRTIGFCVEHPGNETFETTVRFAAQLGACVDINDDSTNELRLRGIAAERFALGYSALWDRWQGLPTERTWDLTYLGTTDPRRSRLLSLDWGLLEDYQVFLAMPPHEPMIKPRPDFFMGEAKLELLRDSKLLLNLHRGGSRSLEWFRYLEAAINGCVVLSEHSPDYAPLVPQQHIVLGAPRALGSMAAWLLRHPDELNSIRSEAYQFIRTRLAMTQQATMLCSLAGDLAAGQPPRLLPGAATRFVASAPEVAGIVHGPTECRARHALGEPVPTARPASRVTSADVNAGVEIILLVDPLARDCTSAIASTSRQLGVPVARVWICSESANPALHADSLDLPVVAIEGASLADAANAAVNSSRAARLAVTTSVHLLGPRALARLQDGLDVGQCDASYGMCVTPSNDLTNALPFEPARLDRVSYLSLPAMFTRESLAAVGFTPDPVNAMPSFDQFWRRYASTGKQARLVPRVIARQAATFTKRPDSL